MNVPGGGSTPASYPRPPHRSTSVQRAARMGALAAGCGLIAYGVTSQRNGWRTGASALALPLLYAGVAGARPWPSARGADTREALSGPRGIHVREAVTIARPPEEVYATWREIDRLPALIPGLEQVDTETADRSRWTMRGPGGVRLTWHAEVINDEPNRVIGWRTLPGSDVQIAGSVRFDEAPGGRGTRLTVHLQYAPPAGRAGAALARLVGRNPASEVREALRHVKQSLEAGEQPTAGIAGVAQ